MKSKHIEKANDLYQKMNSEIEEMVYSSKEDRSLEQVTQDFFKRRVSRQSHQVKKLFEAMNIYNSSLEGEELSQLSLKDYWEDECETKEDFLPEGGYSKLLKTLFDLCRPTLKLGEKVLKIEYSD